MNGALRERKTASNAELSTIMPAPEARVSHRSDMNQPTKRSLSAKSTYPI
jgi:hypothetical protein